MREGDYDEIAERFERAQRALLADSVRSDRYSRPKSPKHKRLGNPQIDQERAERARPRRLQPPHLVTLERPREVMVAFDAHDLLDATSQIGRPGTAY